KIPRLTIDVDILRVETRAALCECLHEHLPQGRQQFAGLPRAQTARRRIGVNARSPQGLVSIDIPHTAQETLIEQRLLDATATQAQPRNEVRIIEKWVERVPS